MLSDSTFDAVLARRSSLASRSRSCFPLRSRKARWAALFAALLLECALSSIVGAMPPGGGVSYFPLRLGYGS